MIEEIVRRPFARPLFLWIMGIMLYRYVSGVWLAWIGGLLLAWAVFAMILYIWCTSSDYAYAYRWVRGSMFSALAVCVAMLISCVNDRYIDRSDRPPSRIERLAAATQVSLTSRFRQLHVSREERSVLSTLTFGYKKGMRWQTRRRFSLAGVAHILAVSGFHVSVVCAFLSLFCSFLPRWGIGRWIRFFVVEGGLWVFVFITGLAAPAVRAAVMLTIYLTGKVLRRTPDSYNTLAAAACFMLVYNPGYLFDVGFQLSFLAVFFILFWVPRLNRWLGAERTIWAIPCGWVTVSIAAQIGTALLCFYYFKQFSTVFLFTNLPVTLLTTFLLPLTFLWLAYPEALWGHEWIQWGVENMLHLLVKVVNWFSSLPYAAVKGSFGVFDLWVGYITLILWMIYLKTRVPKVALMAVGCALAWVAKYLIARLG